MTRDVQQYLETEVFPTLTEALEALLIEQEAKEDVDPLLFLVQYLMSKTETE